jgi:hypothetical protein
MAASRRRQSSGFQTESESIDELSKTFPEEEVVMEQEEEKVIEVKKEPELLPEITPTEAPPPISRKEMAKEEVVAVPQQTPVQPVSPKRHPRNIPRFSKVRG